MSGHIRRRGASSFELKYEAGTDPCTGKRITKYQSFKGSKREAQAKLTELLAAVAKGSHVDPNKITVAEFVRARIDHWEACGNISARTAERYRQLATNQIEPHLGLMVLQKLRPLHIEEWHVNLRAKGRADGKGGIAPRTIGHAHRLLSQTLSDAAENDLVVRNVVQTKSAPRVAGDEMTIVQDVPAFIEKMKPRPRYYVSAMVALFTGMRLSETLALKWGRVDLERKIIKVLESIECTKRHGLRFKQPKTTAGRRVITLPDFLVDLLREHRRSQLEMRLKLGLGKLQDSDLLFTGIDGAALHPYHFGSLWSAYAARVGFPGITFHALRHTHASQLIDAGVDIVTISKRLGHATPTVTLATYAHLFRKDDGKAAAAINAALTHTR
jgi:integrase